MGKRVKQIPLSWEEQPATQQGHQQGFEWDRLTGNMPGKDLSAYDKLKLLWDLADMYRDAGREKDWYKVERWAAGLGSELLDRETRLWQQYLKARADKDERLTGFLGLAYAEVTDAMVDFDNRLDIDFEEGRWSL